MSIAEKLQTIAENEQRVYNSGFEEGKAYASMSGTITFTDATKIMTITDLPSAPKKLNLYSLSTTVPTDESKQYIRGFDYIADGINLVGSSTKVLGFLWLRVSTAVSATATASGSISENVANKNNIFVFNNGTFTIDFSYHPNFIFGDSYTYKWDAIF